MKMLFLDPKKRRCYIPFDKLIRKLQVIVSECVIDSRIYSNHKGGRWLHNEGSKSSKTSMKYLYCRESESSGWLLPHRILHRDLY